MRLQNDITIKIVEARGLRGADKGGTSSDPYAKIKPVKGLSLPGNDDHYKTKVVKKTLNPKWGESFNLKFDDRLSKLAFLIFDWDMISTNDRIGKAKVPVEDLFGSGGAHFVLDRWLPVRPQGELHVIIEVHWKIPIALPGVQFPIPYSTVFSVGLGWDMAKKGKVVDLDASVAAISDAGTVLDSVSFKKLTGMNGAVRHSGDDRTGDGEGDDEVITFDASRMAPEFTRFVITINSFTLVPLSQARSAYVRVSTPQKGTVAFFRINSLTHETGLLLGQVWRTADGWFFSSGRDAGPGRTIIESLPWISRIVSPGSHGSSAHKDGASTASQPYGAPPSGYGQTSSQHATSGYPAGPQAAYPYPPAPGQAPVLHGYTPPNQQQPGYGAPPQPYGFPPQLYGAPPQPYGAPPPAQGYGAYGAPPPGYGAPPPQAYGAYAPPQGYAPPAHGYSAPPQGGYAAPPPPGAPQGYGQNYPLPPASGYPAPPPPGYSAPPPAPH